MVFLFICLVGLVGVGTNEMEGLFVIVVDLVSQDRRTFECDNTSFIKNQIFACGRIPAFTGVLVFDAKFAKTGDENILPFLKGLFDDFKDGFDDFG
jgi:hypothetical protein